MNEPRTSVYERKGLTAGVKDIDTAKRLLIGKFSDYQTPDLIGDVSFKGMFDKSWAEAKARVKFLYEHDTTKVAGKVQELWDDEQGAYYKATAATTKFGDDILEMAEAGLINEHSFGYVPLQAKKNKSGGRDLKEVMHMEVTLVGGGWAIHGNTPLLTVQKAMQEQTIVEMMEARYKALDKFTRNANASDETIELLLLEIKQLQQSIIELSASNTPAAAEALEPSTGEVKSASINTGEVLTFIQLKKHTLTI